MLVRLPVIGLISAKAAAHSLVAHQLTVDKIPADVLVMASTGQEDTGMSALASRLVEQLITDRRARLPSVNASQNGASRSQPAATAGGSNGPGAQ
jgi:hypothetical protein